MILTEEQRESFLEAAKPMIKWMNDNCHPHTEVVIEHDRAELYEGVAAVNCKEFLKD